MEMSQLSYPILCYPPPEYYTLYIDPPAYEPPNPSSTTYSDSSLPPYQPSPQSSASIERTSEGSPPDYCELSLPYCINNGSSLHAPPLDPVSTTAELPPPGNYELPPPYCITTHSSLRAPPAPAHQQLELTVQLKANNSFMLFCLFTFIFFPPFGLVCIIYFCKVKWFIHRGDFEKVKTLSVTTNHINKTLFLFSLPLGVTIYTAILLVCVLTSRSALATQKNATHYMTGIDFSP
ncbi:extensin [Xenopus laevis]|uniref:Uncharacterized protein n=2 Tax=Xenopus laevis TaxID=8355 RepID=A0A974HD29_XENLA|nr:extensin [Xenopus laevis]OCT73473.1 hypothetical protein XELAEV_18036450mg [Xenopus laevis]